MSLMQYLRARLSERTTWVGIGAALSAGLAQVGAGLDPEMTRIISAAIIGAGVVAAIVPNGGGKEGG